MARSRPTGKGDHYYIVMRVTPWDAFEPTLPMPIIGGVRGPDGSTGFLAVFDDRAKAEAWAEGSQVMTAAPARRAPEDEG